MTILIVLFTLTIFVAGAAKGVCDTLQFHWGVGWTARLKNTQFWNPAKSWKNKYTDFDGGDKSPRFWLSTTWLVTFTDAWHSFQFVQNICIALACALALALGTVLPPQYGNVLHIVLATLVSRIVFQIGFKALYR